MKEIKIEAKTLQEAVEQGLKELSLSRDQVEVVVISEGKKGVFGIGSKKACVLLREKKWTGDQDQRPERRVEFRKKPRRDNFHSSRRETQHLVKTSPQVQRTAAEQGGIDRPAEWRNDRPEQSVSSEPDSPLANSRPEEADMSVGEHAAPEPEATPSEKERIEQTKAIVSKLLNLMEVPFTITEARYSRIESKIYIKFESADSYFFTGYEGRGIHSLQYITQLIFSKNHAQNITIQVDTGDYWGSRERELLRKIENAVSMVKRTSRPYRLEPMSPVFRKYIHNVIKERYGELQTVSEGEGKWRKVVIKLKGP